MFRVFAFLFALALSLAGCGTTPEALPSTSSARTAEEAGMVSLQSLVPDIRLDMRYAGSDNFVGRPITGYDAPRCYLLRPAAEALQRVEQALRPRGLRLQIFDCYRPVRAVQDFMAWAADLDDQRTKAEFYPGLPKTALVPGYIAERSGHSRGADDRPDLAALRCAGREIARRSTWARPSTSSIRWRIPMRPARRRSSARTGICCARRWRRKDFATIRRSGGTTRCSPSRRR